MEHPTIVSQDSSATLNSFYRLFDEVPFMVAAFKGPSLVIEYVNKFTLQFWQLRRDEVIGRPLSQARPDIQKHTLAIHEEVYRTGKRFKVSEAPLNITTNGIIETRYFDAVIDPMFNEAGEIIGQLATTIEVTEQVLARKKTEESELLFRTALDGAEMGTFDFYPQTGKLVWSAKTKEHFGLAPDAEVNYQVFLQALHPDDRERSNAITQHVLRPENGGLYENEYRTIGVTDGKLRWVRSKGKISFDKEGRAIRMAGITQDITARKQAEEALKASEDRYQNFIRQSTEGIWRFELVNPVSIHLPAEQQVSLFYETAFLAECNDTMAQMYGYEKAEELMGTPLKQFLPPDDDTQQYLNLFVQSGYRVQDAESKEQDRHGNTKYFINNLVGIIEDGKITRAWGTQRDITLQKEAEQQLRESEVRFRALLTATSDVIYRMNPDWTEMHELDGRGLLKDTGHTIENWLEKYILPYDQEKVRRVINEAVRLDKVFEMEHRVLRADGSLGWIFSRAIPIRDKDGNIIEWFGAASDVSERKRIEQELRKSESRFRSLIEEAPVATCLFVGKEMKIEIANDIMLGYWGKGNSVLGKTLLEALPEVATQPFPKLLDEVFATGKSFHASAARADLVVGGVMSTFYFDFTYKPLRNANGEVYGIMNMAIDVTDEVLTRKKLEESESRFRNLANQLEVLVDERTRELQRSNEDLQQFAHVASHDLKEPVRKIMTFTNRLKEELDNVKSEKTDKYISKIESSAARMYAMIDGVLLYSSLNALDQTAEIIDLDDLIESIESDLEVLISHKKARIIYKDLPSITASSILMYQLFYNLINNSLKFSKPELPAIISIRQGELSVEEIAARGLNTSKKYIKIMVEDNGIGFSNTEAASIFGAFTRLHSKDKYEGTGLGLALCKKIAERHGGTIYADGKENESAVFIVILPE